MKKPITPPVEKVLELLARTPEISRRKMAAALGTTTSAVHACLEQLKSAGQIHRVGPRNTGHWEVLGSTPDRTPPPADFSKLPGAETEALKQQVMRALDAAFLAYVAAWERRDPDAEQLHQRQKQLTVLAAQLRAQRLRQLGAEFGSQGAQFRTASAGLEQSVDQLRDSVRKAGRAIDIATRIDQLLVLAAKLAP